MGCSPWGREESDTTERLYFHFSLSCIGEGNGNPLQCSCLENPRDGGPWWAAVYGVAQSQTQLKQLSSSSSSNSHPRVCDGLLLSNEEVPIHQHAKYLQSVLLMEKAKMQKMMCITNYILKGKKREYVGIPCSTTLRAQHQGLKRHWHIWLP